MSRNIVLSMTGASGAPYAIRLLDLLLSSDCMVRLIISPSGREVLDQELGLKIDLQNFRPEDLLPADAAAWNSPRFAKLRALLPELRLCETGFLAGKKLHYHHYHDFNAPPASGSARNDGMVVCPCSGGTLSAIAQGSSTNLIQRSADVQLKERRKLILVPREMPLSMIHLDNMRRATEAGAIILPAMPGFYHPIRRIQDLIDFVVHRIGDHLEMDWPVAPRWGESS